MPAGTMAILRRLILEAHRRSIWQVLALYSAGSWLAYEVILSLTEGLGLPDWVPPLALVLFIIGLPVVLATAFVQERPPDGPPLTVARRAERYFTWRRTVAYGAGALLLLVVVSGGYMGMRAAGLGPAAGLVAKGELTEGEALVLADFRTLTGDSSLARVVTEVLRTDLTGSPYVSVADRGAVRRILGEMLHPDGAPLDPASAREVAVRLGLKAVIEGEVARAGSGYVLAARVVTADSVRDLAAFRETAEDSSRLVDAIDRLSRSIRDRVGESLRTIRVSPSLPRVTTASLPALRKWAEAQEEYWGRSGRAGRAIRLLNEAVGLDPEFAAAYANLAVIHYNNGQMAQALQAAEKALALLDRLSDWERYRIRLVYGSLTGDLPLATAAAEEYVASRPNDPRALANLSDLALNTGDYSAAEAYARRAIECEGASWIAHWNLWEALAAQDKRVEARRVAERTRELYPGEHSTALVMLFHQNMIEGDLEAAHRDGPRWVGSLTVGPSAVDRLRGRLEEARRHMFGDVRPAGRDSVAAELVLSFTRLIAFGDSGAARSVERIASDTAVRSDMVVEAAAALALWGYSGAAARVREIYESRVPKKARWKDAWLLSAVEGFSALEEGRTAAALEALRLSRSQAGRSAAAADFFLGRAYDVIGRPDSAIAAYTRYLTTPWAFRGGSQLIGDPVLLVPVHAHLAQLHEEAGELAEAAHHGARVIELLNEADPEFQPRVEAARRILARVTGEGGR